MDETKPKEALTSHEAELVRNAVLAAAVGGHSVAGLAATLTAELLAIKATCRPGTSL